jgi:hypothetical protein
MNRATVRTSWCFGLLALTTQAQAADLPLPRDGWVSWQIEAVEGAPDWCCWSSWNNRTGTRTACRLDDENGNSASFDEGSPSNMRVYARLANGKVERVRALSTGCPVETKTPIQELANVATDDSARWLVGLAKQGTESAKRDELGENVMATLSIHRGEIAQDALVAMARGDARMETRKKAVFWLALMRGAVGAEVVSSVMFNDQDPRLREHATFAFTHSRSPRMGPDVTRLGNTDADANVRAQAWFWLAQSGVADSEAAITAALKKDKDAHVREHAVFALSQLPDDRATRALVAVVEDRSLTHEQRKRAVFWLAQSESEGAQKYLEKVLAGNVSH